jgi:hypothetical protein
LLQTGWVIVGSLPTVNGTSATAQAGCLVVINSSGKPVETFYGSLINGPWDMTAHDQGSQATLFFTNVLNGTVAPNGNVVQGGTVVRMVLNIPANSRPAIKFMTVIGSGFSERTDPAALVIGPAGDGLSATTLYVADSLNNRVTALRTPPRSLPRRALGRSFLTADSAVTLWVSPSIAPLEMYWSPAETTGC